jgi:hypothetical protein
MAEIVTKKKKSKVVDGTEVKKTSKKKDKDGIPKRSSSPSRERKEKDTGPTEQLVQASSDFEAGIIFNRYDKEQRGVLTADDFRQIWREGKSEEIKKIIPPSVAMPPANLPFGSFEAGKIFAKFDSDNDGKIDKKDFEKLLRDHPELLKTNYDGLSSSQDAGRAFLPTEVVTGRLLSHYDETAGVALPHSAVDQHRSLGNTVVPLADSYRSRYDRLRSLLTGKLFPRREHLLQIRRQLQNCSTEVAAARKGIERETLSDTEQILGRLRNVEAMRQSSIKHQVSPICFSFYSWQKNSYALDIYITSTKLFDRFCNWKKSLRLLRESFGGSSKLTKMV